MRKSNGGWDTVPPWRHAHEPIDRQPTFVFPWDAFYFDAEAHNAPAYAVGDTIFSGTCRGTVTQVSTIVARIISVVWSDGDGGEIIYPMDATYLRKGLPWE